MRLKLSDNDLLICVSSLKIRLPRLLKISRCKRLLLCTKGKGLFNPFVVFEVCSQVFFIELQFVGSGFTFGEIFDFFCHFFFCD